MSPLFLVIAGSPTRCFYDGNAAVPSLIPDQSAPLYPLLLSVTPLRASAALDETAEAVNITVLLRNDEGQISRLFGGSVGGFQRTPPLAAVATLYRVSGGSASAAFAGTVKSVNYGPQAQVVIVQ